jgi:hypothetical protein
MAQSIEAMQTALRTLTALTEKRDPDAADLDALRTYAPQLAGLPADELACEVIQQALRRRALARAGE